MSLVYKNSINLEFIWYGTEYYFITVSNLDRKAVDGVVIKQIKVVINNVFGSDFQWYCLGGVDRLPKIRWVHLALLQYVLYAVGDRIAFEINVSGCLMFVDMILDNG